MKSKNSKSILSYEERVNAEFKRLRLRIKKLEEVVLGKQETDSGSIKEDVTTVIKG